jgi:hypothetical protein
MGRSDQRTIASPLLLSYSYLKNYNDVFCGRGQNDPSDFFTLACYRKLNPGNPVQHPLAWRVEFAGHRGRFNYHFRGLGMDHRDSDAPEDKKRPWKKSHRR